MASTRIQLGTPYAYACIPRQPVPQAATFAPLQPQAVTGCYPPVSRGYAPQNKDLQSDGKSSWKSLIHKFVRLARSQQWSEIKQHKFCFSLEGIANDSYTLLMNTDAYLAFPDILTQFQKHLMSSVPDFTHQVNFQSASQDAGESLRQWADRLLTLAT
jgi:hypothetical protein